MKNYYYVPTNLDLEALLVAGGYFGTIKPAVLDRFYYFMDIIYTTRVIHKLETHKYIFIHHKYLVNVLTTRWASDVKSILKELEIIEEKSSYLPGCYSKSFRFTTAYRNSQFKRIQISHLKLVERLELQQLMHTEILANKHEGIGLIIKSLQKLEFDFEGALGFLAAGMYEVPEMHRRQIVIDEFKGARYIHRRDPASRIYHVLTKCPRDLRQFVTFKGQPLFSVDICDCQPALHATLFPAASVEKQSFIDVVSQGRFKTVLNERQTDPFDLQEPCEKDILKKELFRHVFYGSAYANNESEIKNAFREFWPSLADKIADMKADNDLSRLPVLMQKTEAGVVIDKVVPELAQ